MTTVNPSKIPNRPPTPPTDGPGNINPRTLAGTGGNNAPPSADPLNKGSAGWRPTLPSPPPYDFDFNRFDDFRGLVATTGVDSTLFLYLAHLVARELRAAGVQARVQARVDEQTALHRAAGEIRAAAAIGLGAAIALGAGQLGLAGISAIGSARAATRMTGVGKQLQPQLADLADAKGRLQVLDGLRDRSLPAIDEKLQTLGSKVEALRAERALLADELKGLDPKIAGLEAEIAGNRKSVELEAQLKGLTTRQQELTGRIADLDRAIGQNDLALQDLRAVRQTVDDEIKLLGQDIKLFEDQLAARRADLGAETAKLGDHGLSRLDRFAVNRKIAGLNREVADLERTTAGLLHERAGLNGDELVARGGLRVLSADRKQLSGEIGHLDEAINTGFANARAGQSALEQKWAAFGTLTNFVMASAGQLGEFGARSKDADRELTRIEASRHGTAKDQAQEFMDANQKLADKVLEILQAIYGSDTETVRSIIRA